MGEGCRVRAYAALRHLDVKAAARHALEEADAAAQLGLNTSVYPVPEMTGTANFACGIAWGIKTGLLSRTYLPVVEKAWEWLPAVALQPCACVSFCQPGGSHPEGMVNWYAGASACWDNSVTRVCANTLNSCEGKFLLERVSRFSAAAGRAAQCAHTIMRVVLRARANECTDTCDTVIPTQ